MITYIWRTIRDAAQNTHRRYKSQRLVTESSEDEDGGEDGLHGHQGRVNDGNEKYSTLYAMRIRAAKLPSWPYWLLVAILAVITLFSSIQAMKSFPMTHLVDEVLTNDGKEFPHGQLSYSKNFSPLPCGNTPSEAISRGCHFDMVATAWLPPRCIDMELMDEFMSEYPWRFYSDQQGLQPLSNIPDTIGSYTDGRIWTTNRWHVAHCLYMWRKLNRALVHGWMTDAETVQQHHTDHCSKSILEFHELDGIHAYMEVIYPPC